MKNQALRQRILAYNREMADRKEKAEDLMVVVEQLAKLPPGQLKKILTEEVCAVLAKYGLELHDQ